MELTPDIAGRATGNLYSDPWFDADHDGDIASAMPIAIEPLASAIATAPPRSPPRSVPPAPDTTFAIGRLPSTIATSSPSPMPESAKRRGNVDTLFSATWFYDASDAAEWRTVAEERRAAQLPTASPAPEAARPTAKRIPKWVFAVGLVSLLMLVMAGAAFLVLTLIALILLA